MAESLVQVTSGGGPKMHTWQWSIGGNNVEDEAVFPGEYPYPTYAVLANGISVATANDHVLQLMAGTTNKVKVRRIRVSQSGLATTAAFGFFEIWRVTTAGTGGTAVTARPMDTANTYSGAAMTLPTVKGTESVLIDRARILIGQSTTLVQTDVWDWPEPDPFGRTQSLIIPAGVANGIVVKSTAAIAAASVNVTIWAVEQAF